MTPRHRLLVAPPEARTPRRDPGLRVARRSARTRPRQICRSDVPRPDVASRAARSPTGAARSLVRHPPRLAPRAGRSAPPARRRHFVRAARAQRHEPAPRWRSARHGSVRCRRRERCRLAPPACRVRRARLPTRPEPPTRRRALRRPAQASQPVLPPAPQRPENRPARPSRPFQVPSRHPPPPPVAPPQP